MKARKKGTQEWKEYKEVFGPDHEFLGLETLGYWQSDEAYCKENGIPYDPESPFNNGGYYKSAVLPLECFDLWEEPDWSAFRRETAKAAMEGILASGDGWSLTLAECYNPAEKHSYPIGIARFAIACADELIKQLKEGKA